MLLEKQKTNPNKMASNTNRTISQIIEPLRNTILNTKATNDRKGVVFSLLVLVSMLMIFPTLLMVVVLGHVGVLRISTVLVLAVLFTMFYGIMIYSIYVILDYYLTLTE